MTDLPQPDEAGILHSQQLSQLIHKRIGEGVISFADYMQHCLYEPGMGYYMAGAHKFGATGDFVTAPEVSPLFGQCMARQCQEVLGLVGGSILELGAGSGKLAGSILNAMQTDSPEHYYILEPSAELQQRQSSYLQATVSAAHYAKVEWLDSLPEDFVGVCIANEVMDALPVELFVKEDGTVQQLCVQSNGEAFSLSARQADDELQAAVSNIETELQSALPDGYRSEVCTVLAPWVTSLAAAMKKGVVLLSDYGYPRGEYYMAERAEGTLACYYQHRFHDNAFFYPGLQDITAHVDFTSVIEAGSAAGFALLGYTSQSAFLLNNGMTALAATELAKCGSEQEQLTLTRAIKMLTLPGEMGERFQFMALGKNLALPLQGFASQDLSHRL